MIQKTIANIARYLDDAVIAMASYTDDVAIGKGRSIFKTKPIKITEDTVFAYKPNYDKALYSWEKSLLSQGIEAQTARTLARDAVNDTMINFGRPLESSVFSKHVRRASDPELLVSSLLDENASMYAMRITSKTRNVNIARSNPFVAEKMQTSPEFFILDETERIAKDVLDKAFSKVKPNSTTTVEYRGARIPKNSVDYQNLTKLKKGDIHTEAGYIWTSPDGNYAFSNYGTNPPNNILNNACIRSHILFPEGSQTLHVDRLRPETLVGYNSQYKVCNVKISDDGNIDLFLEYLKNGLG